MFGQKSNPPAASAPVSPRTGRDVARLSTNVLQVILLGVNPPNFALYLNGEYMPSEYLDNIVVSVEAPKSPNDDLTMQAVLSRRSAPSVNRPPQTNLFPGVIEITGANRRVTVVGTPDGDVTLGLGLEPGGLPTEAHGVRSLSILLTSDVATAHIKWTDGLEEDLFPE